MRIRKVTQDGVDMAVMETDGPEAVIGDASAALEAAVTARYQWGTQRLVIPKTALAEDFFVLSTGLAGEILQKYINYHFKVAIYGDYTRYKSKPLHDFMWESNNGRDVFFVATVQEALDRLAKA